MQEGMPKLSQVLKGAVRVYPLASPKETIYQRKNVIVQGVSFLFAQLLSNSAGPVAGVWGLAVGAGGSSGSGGWSPTTQPDPTATQIAMVSEIKRKQLQQVQYLDTNANPTTTITTLVNFQTVLNATTDNITTPIREMGLIGGGTTLVGAGGPTNMLTAPYFNPTAPVANSITLINYITTPSFILPAGIDMGVDWEIQF
jgi:hypothetical protein